MSFVKNLFKEPKIPKLNPIIVQQPAAAPAAPEPAAPTTPSMATQANANLSFGGSSKPFGRGSLIANGILGGLTKKVQGSKKSLIGGM